MREIFAGSGTAQVTAVVEDGCLVEYFEDENEALADTVILGKVSRIVPGLQAAFIDIGQEKNGFLPLNEKNCSLATVFSYRYAGKPWVPKVPF